MAKSLKVISPTTSPAQFLSVGWNKSDNVSWIWYPSVCMTAPRATSAPRLFPSLTLIIAPSPSSWNAAEYTPSAPIFTVMPRRMPNLPHCKLCLCLRCRRSLTLYFYVFWGRHYFSHLIILRHQRTTQMLWPNYQVVQCEEMIAADWQGRWYANSVESWCLPGWNIPLIGVCR